jgi:hypothetical protein
MYSYVRILLSPRQIHSLYARTYVKVAARFSEEPSDRGEWVSLPSANKLVVLDPRMTDGRPAGQKQNPTSLVKEELLADDGRLLPV